MATRIEVLPIGNITQKIHHGVPKPTTFTVTASPNQGMGATVETALEIAKLGHTVVPHMSARLVEDTDHAKHILGQFRAGGINEIFLVGGDAQKPVGQFSSGAELLEAISPDAGDFRIGIPGYPEGHPLISEGQLATALGEKSRRAHYIVTQMCFDAETVHAWVKSIRSQSITLPVYAGVPGPISPVKLLRVSTKVGVGTSLRVLRSHRGAARLASPRPWDPTELTTQMLSSTEISGLHIYSFNEVAAAYQWHQEGEFR